MRVNKVFKAAKSVYKSIVPEPIRRSKLATRLRRMLPHNAMYDADYYVYVEEHTQKASATIATSIINDLHPRSAIDVGCGTGAVLDALRQRGCEVVGLEYSESGLEYCINRKLDVRKFDIERDTLGLDQVFDVAVSTEVAEHLPESCADRYVDLLTRLAPQIVFTAAVPGQGGTDHVNEQPASYWISKFAARGYVHNVELSQEWGRAWKDAGIASWFWMNIMIFRKS